MRTKTAARLNIMLYASVDIDALLLYRIFQPPGWIETGKSRKVRKQHARRRTTRLIFRHFRWGSLPYQNQVVAGVFVARVQPLHISSRYRTLYMWRPRKFPVLTNI